MTEAKKSGRKASQPSRRRPAASAKSVLYARPELVRWGTIHQLTRGGQGGLEDFPTDGSFTGTQPV